MYIANFTLTLKVGSSFLASIGKKSMTAVNSLLFYTAHIMNLY